jgi:putative solute:sodium symporter small subunit
VQLTDSHRQYWSKNLRITAVLMAIWFFVSFVLVYFSRELNFEFFGWPFSVWVAGQGALIVYCLIVWNYQRAMNELDRAHDVHEED